MRAVYVLMAVCLVAGLALTGCCKNHKAGGACATGGACCSSEKAK